MKVKIRVVIENDDGHVQDVEQVACLRRVRSQRPCPHCGVERSQKGHHRITFRTLFGKLRLRSMRLHHCRCEPGQSTGTFSPLSELLTERTAPELLYLEAKWCSLLSFGVSRNLLQEVTASTSGLFTTWMTSRGGVRKSLLRSRGDGVVPLAMKCVGL